MQLDMEITELVQLQKYLPIRCKSYILKLTFIYFF